MAQTTLDQIDPPVSTHQKVRRRLPTARSLDDSRFFPRSCLVPILIFFWSGTSFPCSGCSASAFIVTKSLRPDQRFVGFENFTDIWKSSEVWGLLGRTLTFMVLSVGWRQ